MVVSCRVVCFALSVGVTWPTASMALDLTPHWQGFSLSAGAAVKPKLDGTEGRALSVVGRARSLSRLVPLRVLDTWRWRPAVTAGTLYRNRTADGVQVLIASAEIERKLGRAGAMVEPYVSFGFGPTLFSDDVLGPLIVGGDLQFTSSVALGVTVRTSVPIRIAYRLSHTSNGGIRTENPGVDISGLVIEFPLLIH